MRAVVRALADVGACCEAAAKMNYMLGVRGCGEDI